MQKRNVLFGKAVFIESLTTVGMILKVENSFDYHDLVWGFQIIAKTEPQLIHQLIDESYDADTCDRIMQYILFGKQIFS